MERQPELAAVEMLRAKGADGNQPVAGPLMLLPHARIARERLPDRPAVPVSFRGWFALAQPRPQKLIRPYIAPRLTAGPAHTARQCPEAVSLPHRASALRNRRQPDLRAWSDSRRPDRQHSLALALDRTLRFCSRDPTRWPGKRN